ncbi:MULTISPECIES: hypothetical protein [unclassified Leptolyngbya]|uniref:hypothetical protein n=1 Tax=unclassified Leptolyngbya TaxID=2650499 RepID=UPI001688C169|nr:MULTISPECIES: hypothetical protein [unclassified Leptolyngbya]MBD1912288.1 hypothetical protein [Leptolyngbya sp. FACHB-8]MBD2153857.1 hypothetical protein [Leptolyngbya sp. FACHB-16]
MNWYGQLTRLVLDYYREDLPQLRQIQNLQRCKVFRRWGVLKIDCRDRKIAEELSAAAAILQEPIAQLRIAHQINILWRGELVLSLPVDDSRLKTW